MPGGSAPDVHRAVEAVWRIESARVVAGLTRLTRDVGLAEDLAQEALIAALESWPRTGVPDQPGAWLTTIAKRRAIDRFRRDANLDRKHELLARELEREADAGDPTAGLGEVTDDDVLRLILVSCHPLLPPPARAALTLRLVGGLTTAAIARAQLTSEATVAQRIVRAKRTLADAEVPFEVPGPDELEERLASVLAVVYLIFNEGYAASAGGEWMRLDLCREAMRLGRILAGVAPQQAEVHGLVALMELQASRARARVERDGTPILLLDQDRSRWDRTLIRHGLRALARAEALGLGPYGLQAAIAACHARARTADETDWTRIAALYELLARMTGSPVVELNRAVAVAMAFGPAAGLELVEQLADEPALRRYHLLPSVRGDLLRKLGRPAEAGEAFAAAAAMASNERERTLLEERAAACAAASDGVSARGRG
ncbi:RNA polymerase sigma factor [Patulibacter defluvii]|uniref:RNA polymerase sigma factor n=1 Tax=Patulibacter defluvii TaxID=3095358 RepID=UPI002A7551B3|nr:RNA polymerase sigma factor [Patulibacter sp. DM4]